MKKRGFAIGAHPDDIEFMMAGALILLRDAGYEIHYMNIANGSCGTATESRLEIVRKRATEAMNAAKLIGAVFHPSLVNDIDIFYEKNLLAKIGAIVRRVNPEIMLVPSPQDYMEDHTNTARLAISAAFCRGMRNFPTVPPVKPVTGNCAVYHALPYGLKDGMRRTIRAEQYVDISSVLDVKQKMLACHRSQKEWLDKSQGVGSYISNMVSMTRDVGSLSGRFKYAEGWRRHSHLGFCSEDFDPLRKALGRLVWTDRRYVNSVLKQR